MLCTRKFSLNPAPCTYVHACIDWEEGFGRFAYKNKNYEILNDQIFCVNFDHTTCDEDQIRAASVLTNL